MANSIDVRDKNNMIIGWCKDTGNVINATHIRKGYVGCYVKSTNITNDANGRIYCYGDGTSDLIRQVERELK